MTIAVGFKCQGGVVLCADTEETADDLKWPVEKVVSYEKEWCQAGFAGAGDGDIADTLIQRLQENLHRRYDSIEKVRTYIRMTLQAVYKNEINLLPYPDSEKTVRLLIAVRPKAQQEVTMFKTLGPVVTEISTFEVIGVGDVVRYVAANLYRDDLTISQGVLLGNHLVSLAKKHVSNVSGDTDILVITSDGRINFERREFSERQERFFEDFNESLKALMLLCPDTSISTQEVNRTLRAFAKDIRALRESYVQDIKKESMMQAVTGESNRDIYPRFPGRQTSEQGESVPSEIELTAVEASKLVEAFELIEAQTPQKHKRSTSRKKKR